MTLNNQRLIKETKGNLHQSSNFSLSLSIYLSNSILFYSYLSIYLSIYLSSLAYSIRFNSIHNYLSIYHSLFISTYLPISGWSYIHTQIHTPKFKFTHTHTHTHKLLPAVRQHGPQSIEFFIQFIMVFCFVVENTHTHARSHTYIYTSRGGAHGVMRCPWCNGYRRRKWTRWHEFKSWTRLIAFHIALIPLGKVWIQLFSLLLWVNRKAD